MNDAQRLARLNEARIALAGDHTTAEEILILDHLYRLAYLDGEINAFREACQTIRNTRVPTVADQPLQQLQQIGVTQ